MPRGSLSPLLLLALLVPTAHGFEAWFQCILIIFFGIEYSFDSDTCMTEFLQLIAPPGQTMGLVTVCIGDDSQGIISGTDPGLPHMRGRYGTNCGMDYGGLWFNPDLVGDMGIFGYRRLAERALQQTPPIPSCWGNISQGQDAWPSGAGFLETYAVGGSFVCGVYSSGLAPGVENMTRELRCWGTGPGASPPSGLEVPLRFNTLSEEEIDDFTTGTRRRRAIDYAGSLQSTVKLVAGQGHACISIDQFDRTHRRRRWSYSRRRNTYLRDEKPGFLACWGENTYGQADPCQWRAPWDSSNDSAGCFGASANENATAAGWFPERVQNIVLGARHTCVLVQFYLQCWGDDTYGQLQNPYKGFNFLPSTLAAGDYHTCGALGTFDSYRRLEGLEAEGQRRLGGIGSEFVCWGRNDAGQTDVPVDVNNIVVTSAAGAQHTCAYVWMAGLICWGSNSHGQTSVTGGFDVIFNLEAFDRGTCYTGFPTTTATSSTRTTSTLTTTTPTTTTQTSTTTSTVSSTTTETATTQTATTSTVTTTPWTSTATTTETRTTVTRTETSTQTTTTPTSTQTVTTGTSTSRTSTVTSTSTSTSLTGTSTVTSTGTSTATTVTSTGTATLTATATTQTRTATSTTSTRTGTATTRTVTATTRTGTATTRTGTATTVTSTATTVTGTATTVTGTATTMTATLTSTTQAPAVTSPEPSTVTATTTKSGLQLKMSFTGVNCGMLMRDAAIQKGFIAAVEQGIIASIADARITRQHIVTSILCRASSRRLQAGGGILDSESVINAQAAQVPVNEIQTSLDTATASGTTKTNVESLVRDVARIAEVTVTGQLPTVGPIIESALVEAITTTVTTTSRGCQMEICVESYPTSAGSRAWLSMCVLMAVALVP